MLWLKGMDRTEQGKGTERNEGREQENRIEQKEKWNQMEQKGEQGKGRGNKRMEGNIFVVCRSQKSVCLWYFYCVS